MSADKDDAIRVAFQHAEHYAAYPSSAAGAFEGRLRELGFVVTPKPKDTVTLTYTQHTVAFPTNSRSDGETDNFNVSLTYDDGGTAGEIQFRFRTFRNPPTTRAVQMEVFGDGLTCLLDPRIQQVIQEWAKMPDPDEMTPDGLTGLLRDAGAVPSRYMPQ